jgi:hypothetical protein
VWAHLPADDPIRAAVAQVAGSAGRTPRALSVAGAVQALAAFAEVLGTAAGYAAFVRVVLACRVGHRPDRVEPRARAAAETLPTAARPSRRSPKATPGITLTVQEVPFDSTSGGVL